MISSSSLTKHALKSSPVETAYTVFAKAEGWDLDLSYGEASVDSIAFPNLELLKALAISDTGMYLYGFEGSAQY